MQFYAIVCASQQKLDNGYGHPHEDTLNKLTNAVILRTDMHGTIIMRSDGTDIKIVAPVLDPSAVTGFIGNRSSMKFHYPICEAVKDIELRNTIAFDTEAEALAAGYEPCGLCHP